MKRRATTGRCRDTADSVRIVHYLNQFFGGIGGEEEANATVDVTEGPVGPGRPLQQLLGDKGEVVGTIIYGDNHINESKDVALEAIRQALVDLKPDLVIAGPAFDAGRYGLINGRQHVPGGSPCGYWHARSGVWNLTTLSVLITMSS